jgi:hypothetical protein
VKAFKEVGFVINNEQTILPWSMFTRENSIPINRLIDVMLWPKTQNGKPIWCTHPFTMSKLHYNDGRLVGFLWPPSNHHWRFLLLVINECTRFYVVRFQIEGDMKLQLEIFCHIDRPIVCMARMYYQHGKHIFSRCHEYFPMCQKYTQNIFLWSLTKVKCSLFMLTNSPNNYVVKHNYPFRI